MLRPKLTAARSALGGLLLSFAAYVLVGSLVLACGAPDARLATATQSIVNGQPDDGAHPYVGALVRLVGPGDPAPDPQGSWRAFCSGSLIAPRVFLTAGHCGVVLKVVGVPHGNYGVSFDGVLSQPPRIVTGSFVAHPGLELKPTPINDVAVILLDEPVVDVALAQLPPAGFLDELKKQGGLVGAAFTDVGYGAVDAAQGGKVFDFSDRIRRVATAEYRALTKDALILSSNRALDLGGTCYGDSGGPTLPVGTDVIAGVVHGGDMNCTSMESFQRLDIESVRGFLGQYLPLP